MNLYIIFRQYIAVDKNYEQLVANNKPWYSTYKSLLIGVVQDKQSAINLIQADIADAESYQGLDKIQLDEYMSKQDDYILAYNYCVTFYDLNVNKFVPIPSKEYDEIKNKIGNKFIDGNIKIGNNLNNSVFIK